MGQRDPSTKLSGHTRFRNASFEEMTPVFNQQQESLERRGQRNAGRCGGCRRGGAKTAESYANGGPDMPDRARIREGSIQSKTSGFLRLHRRATTMRTFGAMPANRTRAEEIHR